MDKDQHERAKKRLEEVTRRLKYDEISPQERERLEREGRELLSFIMSPWLPIGSGYRTLMLVVLFIGLWGFIEGKPFFLLIWLLLPLFSPRIVGKCIRATAGLREP